MSSSAHADDHHHRFQAHHFDSGEQQFQAGKLGMWLFLSTEVLFFSGMFCAYTVYRVAHPEVFEDAAQFLNSTLGAANTIVLLASSLSVAWAVRCAQLNKQGGLLANLMFTLVCAGIFMGVKSVEYTLKFHEGLMWRGAYTYQAGTHPDLTAAHESLQTLGLVLLGVGVALLVLGVLFGKNAVGRRWAFYALGATVLGAGGGCLIGNVYTAHAESKQHYASSDHHAHGEGEQADHHAAPSHTDAEHAETGAEHTADEPDAAATAGLETPLIYGGEGPKFPGVFFSIYYAMTGVHAIHILGGIGVFVWIISRAARHHFDPDYYGPVEYVGLYWHLVDLIWIYLFPLMYLIE